jgi:hypothetical protein
MKRKVDKRNEPHRIDSSIPTDTHQCLVLEAWTLKRAWLFSSAILGLGSQMGPNEFLVPNYVILNDAWLKRHIMDLKDDFEDRAKLILSDWKRSNLSSTSTWFAKQYDAWAKTKCGVFDVGRIHEVEKEIGRLAFRKVMECPAYAQIVIQGYFGAAIRHPEYHLASDIALFYNLLLDSESIWHEATRQSVAFSTQHSQSLARGVILTCYNLLESFTSGLAAGFLLENPGAPKEVVKKLTDNSAPLRNRFLTFPSHITGQASQLDETKPPIKPLFGEFKHRRDSFVHCEPGPEPTKWGGYVKEQHFHDVDPAIARQTIDLTFEAIGLAWKAVHGKDGPRWLPQRGDDGRFLNIGVALNLAESTGPLHPAKKVKSVSDLRQHSTGDANTSIP